MNSFCLRCGVNAIIENSVNVQTKYNTIDTYLSVLGKERLQIKADGHYLPRAVFTGMQKNKQLPNYKYYKQILCKADKFIDFIADPVNYVKHLDCYEKKKIYNSDIVDLIIASLTDIYSVTIIAFYLTISDLQLHIFQPPNETSKTCLDLLMGFTILV